MAQLKSLAQFSDYQYALREKTKGVEFKESKVLTYSGLFYGIELETEKWRIPDLDYNDLTKYWRFVADGSLRGELAQEAVSSPLRGASLVRAIRMLCKSINKATNDAFTFRCSTHVHVNLLDLPQEKLASMFLVGLCADNFMYEAGGGARRGNYNCRPASLLMDEVEQLALLSHQVANSDRDDMPPRGVLHDNRHKYLGTNFSALRKFGTVEFRHFPGSQDPKQIIKWCELIGGLYHYAKRTEVNDVYLLAQQGAAAFGKKVFGAAYDTLHYREQDEDWFETLDTASHFINTYQLQGTGRQTFHGLLEAEYVI